MVSPPCMNPLWLEDDEVQVELLIRHIDASDARHVELLNARLSEEAAGIRAAPLAPHQFRTLNSEFSEISVKLNSLRDQLVVTQATHDEERLLRTHSRLLHVQGRLGRIGSSTNSHKTRDRLVQEANDLLIRCVNVAQGLGEVVEVEALEAQQRQALLGVANADKAEEMGAVALAASNGAASTGAIPKATNPSLNVNAVPFVSVGPSQQVRTSIFSSTNRAQDKRAASPPTTPVGGSYIRRPYLPQLAGMQTNAQLLGFEQQFAQLNIPALGQNPVATQQRFEQAHPFAPPRPQAQQPPYAPQIAHAQPPAVPVQGAGHGWTMAKWPLRFDGRDLSR